MEYKSHKVVADYTERRTQYDVYNPSGKWVGCTNATCWESNCKLIIENKPI